VVSNKRGCIFPMLVLLPRWIIVMVQRTWELTVVVVVDEVPCGFHLGTSPQSWIAGAAPGPFEPEPMGFASASAELNSRLQRVHSRASSPPFVF
jgi:hypothetical protein